MTGCSSRGAALVECALFLLTLFIILFAVFDFGKLVRESNIIVQATHSGARSGAALARPAAAYWCARSEPSRFEFSCHDVLLWPIDLDALGSDKLRALEGGIRLTCSYLSRSGLNPEQWRVIAEGPVTHTAEGAPPYQVIQHGIRVSVAQSDQRSRCLTCFQGLFSSFFIAEQSYFPFQFVC